MLEGMVPQVPIDADVLAETLERLRARQHVVGAQLAIDRGGALADAAAGILNVELGNAVTPDALFQIGSITKVWTATLVMQLVDDGRLELDAPVTRYLDVPSVEPERMARVTIRQLLAHENGIEGDIFTDTGVGDDAVERYVERLRDVGFVHEPGATTSYSNTGFSILGRLIEVVTGQVWDDALQDRIVRPLGLSHVQTRMERLPRYAVAHGHAPAEPGSDGEPAFALVPQWAIPRSNGPAGSIVARAADVARFHRMHVNDGLAPDGTRILSAAAAAEMRRERPVGSDLIRRGLGWHYEAWTPGTYGHDGGTYGQLAFSRIVPELDTIVVLLTNGGDGMALFEDLRQELFGDAIELPEPPRPPDPLPAIDTARFVGTFRRRGTTYRLDPDGEAVAVTITQDADQSSTGSALEMRLRFLPIAEDALTAQVMGTTWMTGRLLELDGETVWHFSGRAHRRVEA